MPRVVERFLAFWSGQFVLFVRLVLFLQFVLFFSVLGRPVWSLPRGVEHFFVSGAERQVNETGPDFGIPVTAVTFGNDSPK